MDFTKQLKAAKEAKEQLESLNVYLADIEKERSRLKKINEEWRSSIIKYIWENDYLIEDPTISTKYEGTLEDTLKDQIHLYLDLEEVADLIFNILSEQGVSK